MVPALSALVWVVGFACLWWRAEPLVVRLLTHLEQRRLLDEAVDLRADIARREDRQHRDVLGGVRLKLAEQRLGFEQAYAMDRMAARREALGLKRRVIAARRAVDRRAVALDRERLTLEAKAREKPPVAETQPMPDGLRRWIGMQSEEFARDQMMEAAGELYADLRDWNAVWSVLSA